MCIKVKQILCNLHSHLVCTPRDISIFFNDMWPVHGRLFFVISFINKSRHWNQSRPYRPVHGRLFFVISFYKQIASLESIQTVSVFPVNADSIFAEILGTVAMSGNLQRETAPESKVPSLPTTSTIFSDPCYGNTHLVC